MNEVSSEVDGRHGTKPPAYAPRITLDRDALLANIRMALAGGRGSVVDARGDGWGHGRSLVARGAIEAGAEGVLVEEGVLVSSVGLAEKHVRTTAERVLDPLQVYGLPDDDGMLRGRPVMTLTGRVLLVKALLRAEGVSYGYTYRAASDTRVALVTGGYGQGVVRSIGNRASVRVGERTCPIIGRVAMDVSMVDVGDAPVADGDAVRFFGDPEAGAPSLAPWVTASGLTAGEIVTSVGRHSFASGTPS